MSVETKTFCQPVRCCGAYELAWSELLQMFQCPCGKHVEPRRRPIPVLVERTEDGRKKYGIK